MAKYLDIANLLRAQIEEGVYPPASLLPTEQQLCETHEVSRQTARQALQHLVEQGLIERRQGSGSRVRELPPPAPTPPRTIAVIATYLSDYIFPALLQEVEAVLSAAGCTIQLYATANRVANERRILQTLLERRPDGILVEGTKTALPNPNLDLYRQLEVEGVQLVFFNGGYRELGDAVTILDDNEGGGRQLVNYLADKGHTHIAGVFKSDDIQGHQRYAGFAAGLQEHGLPLDDAHLYWYNTEDKPSASPQGEAGMERLLATLTGCTAVVCYNDEVAAALVQFLLRRGWQLPDELAVVSFDNSPYSDLSLCRITSLSHGSRNLGGLAAEALLCRLDGRPVAPQVVPWLLVEKESS